VISCLCARLGSNQRPRVYETPALPLSYKRIPFLNIGDERIPSIPSLFRAAQFRMVVNHDPVKTVNRIPVINIRHGFCQRMRGV
jgi:hypothetical protein